MPTLVAVLAAATPAAGQELPPAVARPLEFRLVGAPALRAELLAADRDTIWLLPPSGQVRLVALRAVSQVRARQSGMTARGILIWATLAGLASGVALTAACGTVEDASCGGVLPVTLATWWIVGGVAAAVTGSGQRAVPPSTEALRPYARFPQGLPAGFPLADPRSSPSTREDSVKRGSSAPRRMR